MLTREMTGSLTKWAIPAVALVAGVGYLVAGLVAGDVGFGLGGLAVMLATGLVFVVMTRYSETARGLADRKDERINSIDRDATVVAGMTLIVAALVMFMVEVARGQDGSPYYQLGALAGVAYVVAVVWLRFRR